MRTKKGKLGKKKFSKLVIAGLIVGQLLFSSFFSLLLLSHGPFDTLRKAIIGSAMSTFQHQYLARLLFSQTQINEVLNMGKTIKVADQIIPNVMPTTYDDKNITEEYITAKDGSYCGYLLEISDPRRVKVAMTAYLDKTGQNTSDMARAHDAIAAINGGGFADLAWAGTGAEPSDFVIMDGNVVFQRKGLNKNTRYNTIALDANGTLLVGNYSLNKLCKMDVKVMSAVTLDNYPALIVNGQKTFQTPEESAYKGFQPRTAIGQRKSDGAILLLVLDGRQLKNGGLMRGASLYDVQEIMADHGAYAAANLDGGNSSTMYYNGNVINKPSGELGERPAATSFYVENAAD